MLGICLCVCLHAHPPTQGPPASPACLHAPPTTGQPIAHAWRQPWAPRFRTPLSHPPARPARHWAGLQVCNGFRPPRNKVLTDGMWELIEQCWHDDPVQRPGMGQVVRELQLLREAAAAVPEPKGCACTIS